MKIDEVLQPLFENKIEYIAKQQGDKIKAALHADSSVPSAPNDDLVIETLNTLSSVSKKYLQWLVNRYARNEFRINEDLEVIAEALNVYEQWKKDIGPINNLSLPQLYEAIRPYKEINVDSEKERNLISSGQAEVIYDQGNERIIIPKTYAASEYFAKEKWGTSWCTKAKNMYEKYTQDGPLYMIEINNGEEVYQVHWESNQIMDRNDFESHPKHSKAFQWLIEKRKKEIENNNSENPSKAAFWMVKHKLADSEWVKKVIENDKTGDPSWAAYLMVKYKLADLEWAMKVIENTKSGNPSNTAYVMVDDGNADSEWAMKVIENAKSGNPSEVAFQMVNYGHADSEWAKKVIENNKTENPSWYAYFMVAYGFADKNWYEKVTGEKFE